MTSSKPAWSVEEFKEIYEKALGLYGTIVGLTETPREAAEILCMMHMLLFLNYGDGETPVEDMLADYVKNFKSNYALQVQAQKGQVN